MPAGQRVLDGRRQRVAQVQGARHLQGGGVETRSEFDQAVTIMLTQPLAFVINQSINGCRATHVGRGDDHDEFLVRGRLRRLGRVRRVVARRLPVM